MWNTCLNFPFSADVKNSSSDSELSDEQLEQIVGGVPFRGSFPRAIELNPVNGRAFVRDLTPFMRLDK